MKPAQHECSLTFAFSLVSPLKFTVAGMIKNNAQILTSHRDDAEIKPSASQAFPHRFIAQWRRPRSAQSVVLILAAWLVLMANWPLWKMLGNLNSYSGSMAYLVLIFGPVAFSGLTLLLSFIAWPRAMKPLWILILVLAAVGQYFMLAYGTVIDKSMILNVFQTDVRESSDLFNPRLIVEVLLIAGLPALWLARLQVIRDGFWRNLGRTFGLMLACLAVMAAIILPTYRDLAPLVRNNMSLRFMLNPANSVLAVLDAKVKPFFKPPRPFVSIVGGAALGASYTPTAVAAAGGKTPLFVLVVGETGRGDHYSLNGYGRDTNPELSKLPVLSWRNAQSCGTNTLASVTCMFSSLGKKDFENRKADYDNLLDVLQAAGLGVIWVDNQAGCKGVCDRVPNFSTADMASTPAGQKLCANGECMDDMLLEGLDDRIAKLAPEKRRNGVVVVFHEMGSHGPAYYRRSTPETKVFMPECTTNNLADCPQEQLINVYDNSIRYNDYFLAKTIAWLENKEAEHQVGMLYLSDHGESLGELGLYLHGLPYALAPKEQTHIAVIDWPGTLAARTRVNVGCLKQTLDAPITQDNLYHTVLGLMDVKSPTYKPALDAFQSCRTAG